MILGIIVYLVGIWIVFICLKVILKALGQERKPSGGVNFSDMAGLGLLFSIFRSKGGGGNQ